MSEWIKVADKKPCYQKDVLLSDGKQISFGCLEEDENWIHFYEYEFKPVYWRELPELPKDE